MMSHPPIPIHDLAAHIDDLKANDNMKFSQEYESIEPGIVHFRKLFKTVSDSQLLDKINNYIIGSRLK